MKFAFAGPGRIVFGAGVVDAVGEHAAGLGRRAWLVTGSRSLERAGVVDRIEAGLRAAGLTAVRGPVAGEPDTVSVDRDTERAREAGCDLVIGVGGGSALDAAKAIACLLGNGGAALDYLEVVGRGRPIAKPSVPFVAVPTTAGTGSEATRNAVLTHRESETKASLRSEHLLPAVALVDPALTHGVPPEITAATGLDALTQLIEPYTSRRDHPIVDALAPDAIARAARALPRVFVEPHDAEARAEMSYASLVSGLCLAHAGLGLAHAFAAPLGGRYPVPHGFACAALLPQAMAANLEAAGRDGRGAETIRRFAVVARALGAEPGGDEAETARRGVTIAARLCRDLGVPPLARYGVERSRVPELVARARRTSSIRANPCELPDETLADLLQSAIDGAPAGLSSDAGMR